VAADIENDRGPPRVYDVKAVARALGLSRNTVYELIRQGQIPSVRLGRRILIPREALENLLTVNKESS
jgi:excisionase family DNA binding protein